MARAAAKAVALLLLCGIAQPAAADPPGPPEKTVTVARICELIERHAARNGLPAAFLARLIWKESRFDPNAVSPKGAEGIAQFMPGTAAMRGLRDAFDIERAIPVSAEYLAEMRTGFGNLGLAAAAYNAGEARVSRWMASGGFLPLETEDYVLDIMGRAADEFLDRAKEVEVPPLDPKTSFAEACRKLPVTRAATIAMASVHVKPWGVQVAGNFSRAAAIRQYERLRGRFSDLLEGHDPVVSRVRSTRGRRGIYAVRLGAESRKKAETICSSLRSAGGACVVLRNR